MQKNVEKQIEKIYQQVWKKVFTKQRLAEIVKNSSKGKHDIQVVVENLTKSKDYEKFCKRFAKQLAQKGLSKQKGLWKKYYEAAKKNKLGILTTSYSDYEKAQFAAAVKRNFKMIKSIPQDVLETFKEKGVETVIQQTVDGSVGRKTFEKFLSDKGAKHAKLIARTETAKLQTAIIEKRATDLGSICYRWSSTKDKRTRQSHKDMNNVIVLWRNNLEERPYLDGMYGNAGEFPNCRCRTEPIFDDRDLTQSTYNIYDYRTKVVRKISKQELVKIIKEGDFIKK